MKKIFYLACLAVFAVSCEKDPDLNKLDSNYVVYTDYDKDANFGSYNTFFLPDSILEAGSSNHASYWKDENALSIIDEVSTIMQERGYQRITDADQKDNADLGLQLTYVTQTNQVITGGYWGGWWDYGYWGPWWDSWYYSYPISYSYDTGTLIMEMVDLTRQEGDTTKRRLPIIWYVNAEGYSYNSSRTNMALILNAVDQAFAQSQYIKKN